MDPLKLLDKKKRLLTSFLKYDLLNQAAAETNLYSEQQGRELMEIAQDNPVDAIERLLELIQVQSSYEAFILTLERSIEIGYSQERTVADAQAHEQLANEIARDKEPKGSKDQDDDPLIDASDLGDINISGHPPIPQKNASALIDSRDICKRIPGTIHGERDPRDQRASSVSKSDYKLRSLPRSQSLRKNQKNSKDRLPRSKSDRTPGSLHHLHSFGKQQGSRDRASSMNSPDYKWGSSKLHLSYSCGKNQGSPTITVANSMDTGLGNSTPSLADTQDYVEDDTDGVVRGIPREQQTEGINALFSKFSNFESVILDQLQSFKKGIERLQQSQEELKESVTAEISELRKQIEELKVTATALQELSLPMTTSNNHVSPDMQLDVETTATTYRSEESMETTSTSSEDNNDHTVHIITNSNTLAHEMKLNRLCWIPFGIQTLTVGQEGGLFPLQPQGSKLDDEGHTIIMVQVAENSVNTAVCDKLIIRYGVIAYGSFNIPNGYQLGSMVVYVYFEQEHATKPVVLHLPHWVGGDGEKNLKWIIAPHELDEEAESYPFQLAEGEEFNNRFGAISINGHCSLFGTVFGEEASYKEGLLYYATDLEGHSMEGANLCVMITYASQVWLQILEKYRGTTPDSTHVLFTFEDSTIKGNLSGKQGNGWRAWLKANGVVHRKDVEYKSHRIRNAKDMERAVKMAAYPPFISCQTTYSKEVRRTGVPTKVVLQIEGVKDKAMPFLCTAYEYVYRSEIQRRRPVGHSNPFSTLPKHQTQTQSELKLKVQDLMPYVNDLKDSGFQIAGYLDLTANWAGIEKANRDPADCLVTLLNTWLNDTEVETCPHTWGYFIHIVRELRKGKLADKMAKELSKLHFPAPDTEV